MPAVDSLIRLTRAAIGEATQALLDGGSVQAWQRAMEQAIATSASATYLTGTAQRLGLNADSPLFARNRLTRAERADIAAQVDDQLAYLRRFIASVKADELSPAMIAARAKMYAAGTVRTFYYQARWGNWDIPRELLPGQQQCRGNCKCEISVRDNGDGTGTLTRTLHAEDSCNECPALAGDHPVKRKGPSV